MDGRQSRKNKQSWCRRRLVWLWQRHRADTLTPALHAKQLKLARDLVPAAALVGVLINPDSPKAELLLSDVQTAARISSQPIHILNVRSERDLQVVFATIIAQHVGALVVTSDPFFNSQFDRIVALAARDQRAHDL
jgi:putative tryptophan/tyrosine transport system substrate-binding protein